MQPPLEGAHSLLNNSYINLYAVSCPLIAAAPTTIGGGLLLLPSPTVRHKTIVCPASRVNTLLWEGGLLLHRFLSYAGMERQTSLSPAMWAEGDEGGHLRLTFYLFVGGLKLSQNYVRFSA